jgi:hypothetical protein
MGALAVHKLRYVLGTRHEDEHVHAYLPWAVLIACALVALVLAEFAARAVVAARRGGPKAPPPAGIRWLAVSGLLLAIFSAQEVAEQALTHGHVEFAHSVLADGGWTALPVALAIGAVIALLLRGARALLALVTRRRSTPRRPPEPSGRRLSPRLRPLVPAIACNLAGRGPPSVVIND